MSRPDIQNLTAVYAAVSRGDWDEAFRDADPEFEFRPPEQNPIAATYRGREAIRGFFEDLWAAFDQVVIRPEEFTQLDDRILVTLLMELHPSDSPAKVEMRLVHLWTMRDGKPARCDVFLERRHALEAAGVTE